MNRKDCEVIKKILHTIKTPRQWDYPTANAAFHSKYFKEEIVEPLEKLCGWSEVDEDTTKRTVAELQQENHGERFVNTAKRLERIKEHVKNLFSRKKKDQNTDINN